MGAENRFAGYLTAAAAGSLVYTIGGLIVMVVITPGHSLLSTMKFALAAWLGVFFIAVVSMFLPWRLAVLVSRLFNCAGISYFIGTAAAASLVVGCVISSLFPKPLFVEDQTFFEGVRIAAERQGWLLLLTGVAGGLTYWFVSERQRLPPGDTRASGEAASHS